MDASLIASFLKQTKVLRSPQKPLSTFGATKIEYHLVSSIEELEGKTRLREGSVVSQKPQILTPEAFKERFQGFGDEARGFSEWLSSSYRDLLRALEYNFQNRDLAARVLSEKPQAVADRINSELDGRGVKDQVVIGCPDGGWSLALMKFTLDEAARSFPVNVKDLDRRGLFDPGGKAQERRRREIEGLFAAAKSNPAAREELGGKLRDYGLFQEYEDRFLGLF